MPQQYSEEELLEKDDAIEQNSGHNSHNNFMGVACSGSGEFTSNSSHTTTTTTNNNNKHIHDNNEHLLRDDNDDYNIDHNCEVENDGWRPLCPLHRISERLDSEMSSGSLNTINSSSDVGDRVVGASCGSASSDEGKEKERNVGGIGKGDVGEAGRGVIGSASFRGGGGGGSGHYDTSFTSMASAIMSSGSASSEDFVTAAYAVAAGNFVDEDSTISGTKNSSGANSVDTNDVDSTAVNVGDYHDASTVNNNVHISGNENHGHKHTNNNNIKSQSTNEYENSANKQQTLDEKSGESPQSNASSTSLTAAAAAEQSESLFSRFRRKLSNSESQQDFCGQNNDNNNSGSSDNDGQMGLRRRGSCDWQHYEHLLDDGGGSSSNIGWGGRVINDDNNHNSHNPITQQDNVNAVSKAKPKLLFLKETPPSSKHTLLDESNSSRFYGGLDLDREGSDRTVGSDNNVHGIKSFGENACMYASPIHTTLCHKQYADDMKVHPNVMIPSFQTSVSPSSPPSLNQVIIPQSVDRDNNDEGSFDHDQIGGNDSRRSSIDINEEEECDHNEQQRRHHHYTQGYRDHYAHSSTRDESEMSLELKSIRDLSTKGEGENAVNRKRGDVHQMNNNEKAKEDKDVITESRHSSMPTIPASSLFEFHQTQQQQHALGHSRNGLSFSDNYNNNSTLPTNTNHPMTRLGTSDTTIQDIIHNRRKAGSFKRQTGQRKRLGVRRGDNGVLADSFNDQKIRYAAALAARMNRSGVYGSTGSNSSSGGSMIGKSMEGGISWRTSLDGVYRRGSTDSVARRGNFESRRGSVESAVARRSTAGSRRSSVEESTKDSAKITRSPSVEIQVNHLRSSTESRSSQASVASDQVPGVDSSGFTNATVGVDNSGNAIQNLDSSTHDQSRNIKPKPSLFNKFLLGIANPTQHKFRRKSSAISMLDNQYFVPPPEDGTALLQALVYWLHGHGTDFIVWVYQSSFLGVFVVCLVFYYVMVFAFAGLLLGMKSRCGLDDEEIWSKGQEFELAFELSWTTFTTVGYGKVSPSGYLDGCYPIRTLCALFAFLGMLFNSLSAAILFSKLERILTRASVTFSSSVCLQYGQVASNTHGSRHVYGQVLKSGSIGSLGGFSDKSRDNSDRRSEPEKLSDEYLLDGGGSDRRGCPYPYLEFRIVNDHANYKNRAIWNAQVSAMVQLSAKDVEKRGHRYNISSEAIFREYVTLSTNTSRETSTSSSNPSQEEQSTRNLKGLPASIASTAMVVQETDSGPLRRGAPEGRIYYPLSLEPRAHPHFRRVWYIRHTLNSKSPLLKYAVREKIKANKGWDPAICTYQDILASLVDFHLMRITFKGTSAVSNKIVYSQKLYSMEDVFVGWQFGQIFYEKQQWSWFGRWWKHWSPKDQKEAEVRDDEDSNLMLDKRLIHDIVPQPGGNHEPVEG